MGEHEMLNHRNRQGGFTLMELTVVLAVIGIATIAFMQWQTQKLHNREIERRILDLTTVVEQQYRSWANTGAWELTEADLDHDRRLWAVILVLDDSNPDHLGVTAQVPARLGDQATLQAIAAPFNAAVDETADTVTLTIQVPAQTSIGDSMLDLDGANQMRGNIEFVNPRDIVGADRIDSQSVETDEVDIGGTVIDSPIALLLKTVSEQDCTHGININNDVVSCVAAPVTPPPTPSNCTTSGGTLVAPGTTQSVSGSCSGAGCIPGVCSSQTAGVRPGSAGRSRRCLSTGNWSAWTAGPRPSCHVNGCEPGNSLACGGGPR